MRILVYWELVVLCTTVLEGAPSVHGNENEEAKVFSQNTPHFLSQPLELVVTEGNAVRLPCMVDTLAGFLLIWRKNGRIISIGDQIVDKSDSKFHLEVSKNGNTLVIENVDETDEAHFSCSISTSSGAEIDHNVRVITRMSGHEMDNIAAENHPAAMLEEIEHSEQGSGFVPDKNENIIQIDQEPRDDEEQEEKVIIDNKDASSVGKVYFARIPSFYTFPDERNKDVKEREQLIKHAPKSVMEFLKLLRIYQNSVLTKDDIQEFQEFVFEKKPIPNTHLLRSTHAYNSNLRKRLQSANIKEMENKKGISEEDILRTEDWKTESSSREDVFQSEHKVKDYVDTTSTLPLNQYVGTSRESQSSPEESQEEGSFGDNEENYLESGESDDELKASFSEIDWKIDEDKQEQYYSGVRYLQGHNIGNMEDEDIEYISEDKKFPTLRGQYLPKVDIEDYDWEPENLKEKVANEDSTDDASFVREIESEGNESYETKSKTNDEPENYKELAEIKESEDDASYIRKIESEDVLGKESDETKSKTNEDDNIKVNEHGDNGKETENEKIDEVHVESKEKVNWYESRPEHYVTADRYLQENEIGQVETEQDTGEEDTYIPLFRGQHLLKTHLQVFETEHREDADEDEKEKEEEALPETEESEKDIQPKHISHEGRVDTELHNEAEETQESYFPLSCCQPKTNLNLSETEEVLDEAERYKEILLAETAINSKQISKEERLEIELYKEPKETPDEVFDKHGEETIETLYLDKKNTPNESLDIDKHGENIHKKFDDNNLESKAHLYEEANYEKYLSSSPRYLNEDEIEQIEDETDDLTTEAIIPVIRGQHLPQSTLEEFNSKHLEYMVKEVEESFKPETSDKNGQILFPEALEKIQKHVTPESSDIIETLNVNQLEHSVKDSKNILHVNMEKETLYPQEIKDIEHSYFTHKPQEEKVLLSGKDTKTNDGSDQVTEEHHQKKDLYEQATNKKMAFDQDRKIEDGDVLVSSEHLHKNDLDEDATEIRIAQDKEMGPLEVVLKNSSKKRIVEHTSAMEKKGKNKESRRDGPHPFRFICMLKKCGA